MRIAIVGTGISGLTCAHVLAPVHDVTVFEADDRPGGHTNTVRIDLADETHEVDTGFIVFNEPTYPGFNRLLGELGVDSAPTDMSFSVTDERTRRRVERQLGRERVRPTGQHGPARVLADARATWRASTVGPVPSSTPRSSATSRWRSSWPTADGHASSSTGTWCRSAPRSGRPTPPPSPGSRPRPSHGSSTITGMLRLRDRIPWRTVPGGARRYVDAISRHLGPRLRVATPIDKIVRRDDHVELRPTAGEPETFDHVIVATHSDQALALLADPSRAEREVLGAIRYQPNTAVLHTDAADAPAAAEGLGELELPAPRRRPPRRDRHLPHEPAPESRVTSRDLSDPEPDRRDQARCHPRQNRVRPPGLRSRSDASPTTSRRRSATATALPTAARTGATASTRTASPARGGSAPIWECRGEQRDLRGQRLPPPVPAGPARVRVPGRAPAHRPRRAGRSVCACILSGRGADPTRSGGVGATSTAHPSNRYRMRSATWCNGQTGRRPTGPVRVLAHLRTWGWLFNPIACYWCSDSTDTTVEAFVADVTSTPWHGRHAYVVGGAAGEHWLDKRLHVSPFLSMDQRYRLSFSEPGERVAVRIESHRDGQLVLDAGITARRHPISPATLGRMLWRYPMMTARVSAAIYLEAGRLAAKRVPFHAKPARAVEVGSARTRP